MDRKRKLLQIFCSPGMFTIWKDLPGDIVTVIHMIKHCHLERKLLRPDDTQMTERSLESKAVQGSSPSFAHQSFPYPDMFRRIE